MTVVKKLLLVVACCASSAWAQVPPIILASQPYAPLSGATALPFSAGADLQTQPLTLPFAFPYFGTNYTQAWVSTKGVLGFGTASTAFSNVSFPSSVTPNNFLGPLWEDCTVGPNAQIRYVSTPTSVTIEWHRIKRYQADGEATFQVTLDSSGIIIFHYGTITGSSEWNFSAGFEDATGMVGANVLPTCTATCGFSDFVPNRVVRIGEPDEADLTVPTVTTAGLVRDGDDNLSFTVNATIRNIGRTGIDAGFEWAAYLSTDQVLSPGTDILVATGTVDEPLPPVFNGVTADGGVSQVLVSALAATTTAPPAGEYYVLVHADSTNVVEEASDANNTGSSATSFTQGVDLVAQAVSGPALSSPGALVTVNLTLHNRGTVAHPSPVPFRILLSFDQTLDATDTAIYNEALTVPAGETVATQVQFNMPVLAQQGEFHYLLVADPVSPAFPNGVVAEALETNNVVASAGKVTIRRADIVVDSMSLIDVVTGQPATEVRFGEPIRAHARLRNIGQVESGPFNVGIVLSADATLSLLSDTRLCMQAEPSLPNGGVVRDIVIDCVAATNNAQGTPLATGQYFVFVHADVTSQVAESNEQNNAQMVGPLLGRAPAPDVAATALSAPTVAGASEVIPVVRTLRNLGNVNAGVVKYRYYASANDIITPADTPLPVVSGTGELMEPTIDLPAGAVSTDTELLRVPAGLTPGTYYVGCIIDTDGVITNDYDPANNMAVSLPMQVAASSLRLANTLLPDAVVGLPYTMRLAAEGEQGPTAWALIDDFETPPAWLSLDASTGLLHGTPDGTHGIFPLTVELQNAGRVVRTRLALRVLPLTSGLTVTTTALPVIVNDTPWAWALGAAGGVPPYTWHVQTGALPAGVTLSAAGKLSGTAVGVPAGQSAVTFAVTDALGIRATATLSVRVVPPGAIGFLTLGIADAMVGQPYLQDIEAGPLGGASLAHPVVWRVSGRLPAGLTVTSQSEIATVSGRPTEAGFFTFGLTVEDRNGRTATLDFSLNVHAARYRVLALQNGALRPGDVADIALTVSPPQADMAVRLVNGALPTGLSLVDGRLTGTVAEDVKLGCWPFVVEVTDSNGLQGFTPLSLEVEARPAAAQGCSSTGTGAGLLTLLLAMLAFTRRRGGGFALAALVALLPFGARAQYQVTTTPTTYTPLTNGERTDVAVSIAMPFDFPFFDTVITAGQSVQMSRHGYLAVLGSVTSVAGNAVIPTTSAGAPKSFLAPWWDTLDGPANTAIGYRYLVTGSAPNRVMAFEWNNVGSPNAANRISFQVQLYETTGRVRFLYSSTLPGAASASVGIQRDLGVGMGTLTCGSTCGSQAYAQELASKALDFYRPPDFEIIALSASQTGYANVPFQQTATVRNSGGRPGANVPVRFYLSENATLEPATDVVIGEAAIGQLPAPGIAQATINAPLPASLTVGSTYYLFARVDPDSLVSELSEENNTSAAAVITIGTPTADFTINSITAPTTAAPGQALNVSRTFANVGNAASPAAKYTWFLSDNASVSPGDRALSVGNLAVMAAHSVHTATEEVTLPADVSPGTYWLGACVNYDAGTAQFGGQEITIVNNCFTRSQALVVSSGTVAISTQTLPTATRLAPYGLRLAASGGTGAYVWALDGGALPAGMTLSAAGDLTGSPSVAGSFSFQVKVSSGSATDTAALSLQVAEGGLPLTVVPQTLTAAEAGRVYSVGLVAVGGAPPYTWAQVNAEGQPLPTGLLFASDGRLEGRPQAEGDFSFTVRVTDSEGATSSRSLSLTVVRPTALAIGTTAVEQGRVGAPYLQKLVATGGVAPYFWTVVRFQRLAESPVETPGPLLADESSVREALRGLGEAADNPNDTLGVLFNRYLVKTLGLSIDDRETVDYFSGTPLLAGTWLVTFRVRDASGESIFDSANVLLRVSYRDGLAITTVELPDAFVNRPWEVRLSHNGGAEAQGAEYSLPCVQQVSRGEYSCVTTEPTQRLPPGLTLAADGTISGTVTGEPGVYTFLVKLTDRANRQDVRALAVRVRPDYEDAQTGCSSAGGLMLAALAALLRRRKRANES